MLPLVSVCMPARNAGGWIADAINSILSQTYSEIELIVVDDSSTDNTHEVVEELAKIDERIKYTSSSKTGVVGARQTAYRQANGYFVANMDADDIALPNRIEAQVAAMSEGLNLCGTQFDFIFGDERRPPRHRLPLSQIDAFVQMFRSNPVSNPSIMFRRNTFGTKGLPYNASYVPSADYELWSRLLRDPETRFANLPDVHMLYRAHPGQLTQPKGFANRVASMRVRLELFRDVDIHLSQQEKRVLCQSTASRTNSTTRSGEYEHRVLSNLERQFTSKGNQIFNRQLQTTKPISGAARSNNDDD